MLILDSVESVIICRKNVCRQCPQKPFYSLKAGLFAQTVDLQAGESEHAIRFIDYSAHDTLFQLRVFGCEA